MLASLTCSRRFVLAVLVALAAACAGGCGSKSLVGQPCKTPGESKCDVDDDPNRLLRCDAGFFVQIADCASQCIADKAPVVHDQASIDSDETWACADGPHQVNAPLTVSAGVTLTIEAGAEIVLQPASHIETDIAGRIDAIGTGAAPILVTALNGVRGGYGDNGDGGLDVFATETGQPSDLENVILERGIQGLGVFGLSATATPPVVKNNTLRDNLNFGIIVTCNDGAVIPDFAADGNQFFGNGGEVSACGQQKPGQ